MAIKVGDQAPEATLVGFGKDGKPGPAKISDLKGAPALLLFFPLVNTGVCHSEMCSVRDSIARYNSLKARVVAISVDSPFSQKFWAEKEGFTFEFWSDFNKEAIRAFDCYREDLIGLKGVANRSAFVLDQNGVVRFAAVSDDPKQVPDFSAIQDILAKL